MTSHNTVVPAESNCNDLKDEKQKKGQSILLSVNGRRKAKYQNQKGNNEERLTD